MDDINAGAAVAADHEQIVRLLQGVRFADGCQARAAAFERCKPALRTHELALLPRQIASPVLSHAGARHQHCHVDRSTILVVAIMSELEIWPLTNPGWMKRFGHLETAFRMHAVTRTSRSDDSAGR